MKGIYTVGAGGGASYALLAHQFWYHRIFASRGWIHTYMLHPGSRGHPVLTYTYPAAGARTLLWPPPSPSSHPSAFTIDLETRGNWDAAEYHIHAILFFAYKSLGVGSPLLPCPTIMEQTPTRLWLAAVCGLRAGTEEGRGESQDSPIAPYHTEQTEGRRPHHDSLSPGGQPSPENRLLAPRSVREEKAVKRSEPAGDTGGM